MPTETNYNAFCADYSDVASCLFAIQAAADAGSLAAHPEIAQLLYNFDWGVLRRLYNRAAGVLGGLKGFETSQGRVFFDFNFSEFNSDFNTGVVIDPTPGYADQHVTYTPGDYSAFDFSEFDFSVDLIDETNDSYSSHFQTILNLFGELCSRAGDLSAGTRLGINSALIPVINEFNNIKSLLTAAGINLCVDEPVGFTNSPYLYLQASGADGSDGVAAGVHLRWSLAGDLGVNHLPQGDHYAVGAETSGYNRPDDYVSVSRTPYVNPVTVILELETAPPAIDFAKKQWSYMINTTVGEKRLSDLVLLTFTDQEQYNQLAATTNPQSGFFDFLKGYNGPMELKVQGQAVFSLTCDFRAGAGSDGLLKIEALSSAITDGTPTETTNVRLTAAAGTQPQILGDNMVRFRLQKNSSGFIQSVSFETYAGFIGTRADADWTQVGDGFGLSTDQGTVFNRLETSDYPIDNLWPQYNDGTRVRIANYQDKWLTTRSNDPSVKDTVERYLELSAADPRAEDVIRDDDASADTPGILISYLDVLNLMALDFHLARMLGLGCIDAAVNTLAHDRFIYKISYINLKSPGVTELIVHEYVSLPTGKTDSRLPEKPVMRPVSYSVPVGDNDSASAFDSNGYMINANIRLVNIGREPLGFELPAAAFYADQSGAKDYNLYMRSRPVLFGIDYRQESQTKYIKPEITSEKSLGQVYNAYDDDFADGVPETTPVPDNPASLYVHFERTPGVHYYAIYGINWFSRASVLSDEAATDASVFPLRNTLLPPSAVAVQYIQQEDTLLFTTSMEQGWLAGRTGHFAGQDVSFTRLTFNWLDITDISYVQGMDAFNPAEVLKPTAVKPWFRPDPPLQVAGVVTAVLPAGDDLLLLSTGSYALFDGTTVTPVIATEDIGRFTGSLLTTPEGQFAVQSVASGAEGPVFTIAKIIRVVNVEDDSDPNVYATRNTYILPAAGSRFTVTENLSEEANWLPVAAAIDLVDFTDPLHPVIDESTDTEGNVTRYLVGGLSGGAVVSQLLSTIDGSVVPGYYSVTFEAAVTLPPHPQSGLPFDEAHPENNAPGAVHPPVADWYNGLIRVPVSDTTAVIKQLNVIRIKSTSPLQVYVYDPGYLTEPIQLSATARTLVNGINFHPGYKVYLFPEPPPDYAFNGTQISPPAGLNDKKTFVGLQATDTGTGGSGYVSTVSMPVILLARRIEEPVRPDKPVFSGFRVRPDSINKAAFTLDLKIAPDQEGATRNPFGVAFYRTTNEDVLNALYNPGTVTAILAALGGLTDSDDDFNQRYGELVNLIFDPVNPEHFRVVSGYGFPDPDKTDLVNPLVDTFEIKVAKYHDAIMLTLLPLTAQVPVVNFIREGKQTDKKQPVIRTTDGNLLTPGDSAFDPFPMIRKYTDSASVNTTFIRFTDYSLTGASRLLYFYGGAEVTNQLVTGELSPFAGPISVIHTSPPEAPVVRFFSLGPPATESTVPIAVAFSLASYLPGETITKVRIYRSLDEALTFALQSMTWFADQVIVPDALNGIVITDTFSDLPAFPAGETIYYRLAFIRSIINEKDESEEILGYGSKVMTIRVIDTINPGAPTLTYDESDNKLSWLPTTNKGNYYLYQQNSKGNWQVIYKISPVSQSAAMEYVFPAPLALTDSDGNRIYYRFKVKVENSSGLMNLTDNEITI